MKIQLVWPYGILLWLNNPFTTPCLLSMQWHPHVNVKLYSNLPYIYNTVGVCVWFFFFFFDKEKIIATCMQASVFMVNERGDLSKLTWSISCSFNVTSLLCHCFWIMVLRVWLEHQLNFLKMSLTWLVVIKCAIIMIPLNVLFTCLVIHKIHVISGMLMPSDWKCILWKKKTTTKNKNK